MWVIPLAIAINSENQNIGPEIMEKIASGDPGMARAGTGRGQTQLVNGGTFGITAISHGNGDRYPYQECHGKLGGGAWPSDVGIGNVG